MIGDAIDNYQIFVLNADLTSVLLGGTGELYVGGAGLARGYHSKPDITRSCFIESSSYKSRLYRTDDIARFTAPERIKFLGRIDNQVKVRGHRIELKDVETVIETHEQICAAIVVSFDGRLVVYCVRNTNGEQQVNQQLNLASFLRPWLAERFPIYMLPALFVELDALSITLNSKIDRNALSDSVTVMKSQAGSAPFTDLEREILKI